MGRSKFPGKPSKHGNRTRVNVLATSSVVNNVPTTTVALATSPAATNGNASAHKPHVVVDDDQQEDQEANQAESDENLRPTVVYRTRAQLLNKKKNSIKLNSSMKKRTHLIASNSPLTRSRVTRRSVHGLNRSLRKDRKDNCSVVGKFVLPSRSVHSSRVIKPNKRFISIDQDTRIIRKRVKRLCNGAVIEKSTAITSEAANGPITDVKEESEDNPETAEISPSKVVLRQARLQLNSKILSPSTEGPFSATSQSPSRTITCGVCGAVRIYRFLKHARKFNIFSCEACRKFISKQIKRATLKDPPEPLNCLKGQGLCHVPPNVRSQLWKLNSQYISRCPACWLKLCLRAFLIPMALKTSLTQLLPKNMQPIDALNTHSLPLLTWQAATDQIVTKEPFQPSANRTSSPLISSPLQTIVKTNETTDQIINLRQRSVRLKQTKIVEKSLPQVEIKRAKVDLKGPRVKHVCRSASIVLGQLPATFSDNTSTVATKIDEKEENDISCKNNIEKELIVENTVPAKKIADIPIVSGLNKDMELATNTDTAIEKISDFTRKEVKDKDTKCPCPSSTASDSDNGSNQSANTKKDKLKAPMPLSMLPMEITKPSFNKKCKKISQLENPNMINIDFWENYDPDEVICSGYGIIATEAMPMRAICFLCGSAGKEALVHCCLCCEPYHPYCLEQGPPHFERAEQRLAWVCPKCTKCSACGETDKQKINCQKCHKAYHPQCFNHKWRTDDRPTVCSNCLRCKSCGTDNITKFVGNLALCLACFKLRNKGNFCPLCQCCYDDNDFDTKMMECGKCNKWVHAKCEGLSDEQYQILSILPESVEFICCLCTTETIPYWRKAVQQELRSCLNNILRMMSKNRIAREAFKLTPLKMPSPHVRKLQSARRLQFIDSETDQTEADVDIPIENDADPENSFFKNKIEFGDSFGCANTSFLNDSKIPISPRMVEIKNKLNCNEYFSLHEFNESMEAALASNSDGKLLEIYHSILKNVLPWFDPAAEEDANKTLESSRLETQHDEHISKYSFDDLDFHSVETLDTRGCNLCKGTGDGLAINEARLLYCGQNEWVHANCALWSSEVYEEIDGSLQNVQAAITRGRSIRCSHCNQRGATVGCCLKACHETYHFPCAQKLHCHFVADRTMYCHTHESPNLNLITNPNDFAIRRSVYIEVDIKKKKLCDRDRIRYMVGSLSVGSLGRVIPSVSDSVDAIIPVGFVCSRLFWSTTEPWKLIPYKITTSMFNSQVDTYVDKNFTVDHSLSRNIVERKLKEILLWQKDDKERSDIYEFEDYEEPQNAGDILSPELTDAILEELPHDLLEGLSMQDMLKEYEELMNMEFKNAEINSNDINLNISNDKDDGETKELKIKSEMFQKIEDKMLKPRNQQQRSCSLAYFQLDNTLSPAIKKRKITTPSFMQIVQVDGACDSGSECGSPTHESEDLWAPDADVKCEKCHCTYRTKISYERHLQTCDAMFTSESETEENINTTTEEQQSQVIYESFSYQATQNAVSKSTVMNTQTMNILESKTQVQDTGVIYNYHTVKPLVDSNLVNTAQYCVNTPTTSCIIPVENTQPQVLNQINPIIEPVTIQSVPYTQDMSSFINLGQQNPITIDTKMLAPVLNLQQNQWRPQIIPKHQQTRCLPKARAVVTKAPQPAPQRMVQVLPQNSSVFMQHVPSSNMFPLVDTSTFQQPSTHSTGVTGLQCTPSIQGLQYVVAPQVNQIPQVSTPTAHLVQLPDNNFLSLVQNVPQIQPTMIIQQPRMETGQLMIDSNVSMIWTQPLQPLYYETVQTTVMQSQQFMPTTMPGMLTTNSSYSVFQTSKLEPCLDGSYVLMNQNQLLNQNQLNNGLQVPHVPLQTSVSVSPNLHNIQIKPTVVQPPLEQPQSQTVPIQVSTPVVTPIIPIHTAAASLQQQTISVPVTAWNSATEPSKLKSIQVITTPVVSSTNSIPSNTNTANSITLPVAPFVPEQGIPTNIVTPTPKPPPSHPQARPMSRVLPMQTTATQKKSTVIAEKLENKVTILGDVIFSQKIASPLVSPTITVEPPVTNYRLEVKELKNIKDVKEMKNIKEIEASQDIKVMKDIKTINDISTIKDIKEIKNLKSLKDIKNIDIKVDRSDMLTKVPKCEKIHLDTIKLKESQMEEEFKKSIEAKVSEKIYTINIETHVRLPQEKNEDKDVLKQNKIPIAPLKPIKTKIPSSTMINPSANKENILSENLHEPKYSKQPNTTSIYFKIESSDGFDYTATSLPQIWRKVFAEVQAARSSNNLPPLPDVALKAFNDLDILGLKTKGMRFLIEQLPDAGKCKQYKPLYHKPKDPYQFEDDNDEDSARRCVSYDTIREKYDMFGWLSSKHRTLEMYDLDAILRKNASSSLPMAMRFRALRVISKYSVGVYRSDIHGRGLFSLRDIESGEMVIEYAGEVIRSVLTDKREHYYSTKGIGCYMFRIDDNLVVDATMKGNAARFINHSCDPNCYSKVVEILGNKHIIIFALRKIICGEELTYDYKFPFEEDKIPCTCGTKRCRKFLN